MPEKISARERLLRAASELFYKEGVGATGIDAITAHAGVAKMSLYNNFSSKADLVDAYLRARHAEWRDLYRERLSGAATPRERILAIFDSYVDHAGRAYEWGFRGCGLLNAAAELSPGRPGAGDSRLAEGRGREPVPGLSARTPPGSQRVFHRRNRGASFLPARRSDVPGGVGRT